MYAGHYDIFKVFINNGNINRIYNSRTILRSALYHGNLDIVKFLISEGANIDEHFVVNKEYKTHINNYIVKYKKYSNLKNNILNIMKFYDICQFSSKEKHVIKNTTTNYDFIENCEIKNIMELYDIFQSLVKEKHIVENIISMKYDLEFEESLKLF